MAGRNVAVNNYRKQAGLEEKNRPLLILIFIDLYFFIIFVYTDLKI
jgi:hypothetical protein